jgi:hypothetical protein
MISLNVDFKENLSNNQNYQTSQTYMAFSKIEPVDIADEYEVSLLNEEEET